MLVKLQCTMPLGAKNTNINTKYETEKQAHINIMQIMMFAHWNSETLKHWNTDVHVFTIYKRKSTHAQINKGDRKCNLLGGLCLVFCMPQNGSHCGAVAHEGPAIVAETSTMWLYAYVCAPRKKEPTNLYRFQTYIILYDLTKIKYYNINSFKC